MIMTVITIFNLILTMGFIAFFIHSMFCLDKRFVLLSKIRQRQKKELNDTVSILREEIKKNEKEFSEQLTVIRSRLSTIEDFLSTELQSLALTMNILLPNMIIKLNNSIEKYAIKELSRYENDVVFGIRDDNFYYLYDDEKNIFDGYLFKDYEEVICSFSKFTKSCVKYGHSLKKIKRWYPF